MKKKGFLILVICLLISAVYGQKSSEEIKWTEFVAADAGFKILFQKNPEISSVDVMTTPVKRTNHRFEVSFNYGYFSVQYSDHPLLPKENKLDLKANYDYLKKNLLLQSNAEIISEREIYLGKNLGHEVVLKVKDEAVSDRFFLIDNRLYQLIVAISYKDLENNKIKNETNKFLDSFTLIESNQK